MRINFQLLALLPMFIFSMGLCDAQKTTQSPYSIFGLGVLQSKGSAQHLAMGNTKLGTATSGNINVSNPASYSKLTSPIFEVGLESNTLTLNTNSLSQKANSAFMKTIALGFPVTKWWGTSFGIVPYSSMGYDIIDQSTDEFLGRIDYKYEGIGGINQFYFGNAFSIEDSISFFSFGFNASYMFGSLEKISRVIPNSGANAYNTLHQHTTTVSDIMMDFGLYYSRKLNNNVTINLGASFAEWNSLQATQTTLVRSYIRETINETYKDTIKDTTQTVKFDIPKHLGVGISLEIKNKLTIAIDGFIQDWSHYSRINTKNDLTINRQLGFGFQYVSDINANTFFKLVRYRMGVRYADTYLKIDGEPLNEYGFTFGVGLPLRKSQSKSIFNIGAEWGQRGTKNKGLIQEEFLTINFGLSFTPHKFDRWFVKRKIE